MLASRLLFAFTLAAAAASLQAQTPPPGFSTQTLFDGPLQSGTAMAFLPDGRLLITERETGRIRVYRDGALQTQPWATLAVNSGGSYAEQGLLGIAVDPGFLSNHYVYVFYTAPSGAENRIGRLTEQNGVGTNLTVLNPGGSIASQLYHNSGPMVFGFDGHLYVATGDAMNGLNSEDLQSWNGKVLRFAMPNLTVPAGNPFAGSPIWSLGHRNQFGLTVHPVTGTLYQTENGGALMDELNRILPGADYGWPVHEGVEQPQDPNDEDPLAWYQPTTAPTGCCFYSGSHYPALYRNAWFFTDYNQGKVRALWLDASGGVVTNQVTFDTMQGAGYGVVTAPDGNLWYLTNDLGGFGADELGRYVHQNESVPSAHISSVSNKTLGASLTICVHGQNGGIALPWLSFAKMSTPVPTPFGNLWVPGDAIVSPFLILHDDRGYLALPVPNAPAFLGASFHTQAVFLDVAGMLALTNPSELVIRG